MQIINVISSILLLSFTMFWQIFWALIIGFGISAVIQALVSKAEVAKTLPDNSFKSLVKAGIMGSASSSCSYASVAIA